MAITLAVVKGSFVYVYDGNKQLYTLAISKNDELVGYTSSTVSVKRGSFIHTYDEKGRQISSRPV